MTESSATAQRSPEDDEALRLREVLTRAVARVCPAELSAQREDIVQAALVRILELRNRGEEAGPRPASYLWRVATTTALDELRRARRRREVKPGEEEEQRAEPRAPEPRPELRLAMTACMSGLVSSRRQAVALYLHGFSAEEAARSTGWAVKRVQNLIFRGLNDLRRCLATKGISP